jgi:DNA sulfur modification protein DndD
MKIELLGWSSRGLRCPDVTIDLTTNGKVAPVSLIQMPNGTGKTTTLQMLMAALDGEAGSWNAERVRSFQRSGDEAERGEFIVQLLMDDRPLTFELILDYTAGTARYRTTHPGSGGVTAGHHPPPALVRFLRPQFINLFVFDGEFADHLLDPKRSEAEKAIDALCQLYLLDDIADFADQEWQRTTKKKGTATTASGLAAWQGKRTTIAKRLNDLTEAQTKAKKEQAERETTIAALTEAIGTHMSRSSGIQDQYAQAQAELQEAEGKVTLETSDLMQAIRVPYVLHPRFPQALSALKNNLDKLQLPENTSAQFFEELAREDHCICGRDMTDIARDEIAKRAKQYLGTEEAGVINALKRDIDQVAVTTAPTGGHARVVATVGRLNEAVRLRQRADGKVRALKQQQIDQGDDKVREWEKQLQENLSAQAKVVELLKLMAASGDDDEESEKTFTLSLLKKRLDEADQKISEITETVQLNLQTKLIKRLAADARDQARDQIRALVLAESNKTLRKVLSQDPVQIDRISDSLQLAHQSGASVGQTLAVGYTFLMTVLSRGQNRFPLVVDSPANPLDAGRRRRIGELIPQLCSQFVGFTISTERLGFVNALEATKTPIKYLTMFRKTSGTKNLLSSLPSSGVTQSPNAVVIEDRSYFHAFDMEEEAE